MTESELIIGLKGKSEPSFKELVNRFQDNVFNTAIGLLQNHVDAEDITQEVFIQVYQSINQFQQNSGLGTWIYRITVNRSLDHLRSKKRKKRFGFFTSLWSDTGKLLHEQEDFVHPGVLSENKEDATMLFKLIAQLPENQQAAFILNKVEDLSYREIANILNITESAVDSLLHRAKQNLRKKINNSL